jgi:hypothetical protein
MKPDPPVTSTRFPCNSYCGRFFIMASFLEMRFYR